MRNLSLAVSLIFLSLASSPGQSRTAPATVRNQITISDQVDYEESIYLHVNSDFLLTGESLFFNAYCSSVRDHTPSTLSSIAYIGLVDANAALVLQTKVLLQNGQGAGDFFLPSTLSSGNYTLIAYTNWMKNFSLNSFFRTQISIINPFRRPNPGKPKVNGTTEIDFFPEGGNLVSGIENTIAVRVLNQNKEGISCQGRILDNSGSTLREFSVKGGVGRFAFLPESGKEYKAVITDSLQNVHFKILPPSRGGMIGVHVEENETTFMVRLKTLSAENQVRSRVLVSQGRRGVAETELNFESGVATVDLRKSELPDGICQIKVLNGRGETHCERSIFNRRAPDDGLRVVLERENYNTRSEASVVLEGVGWSEARVSISVRKVEQKLSSKQTRSRVTFASSGFLPDSKGESSLSNLGLDNQMLMVEGHSTLNLGVEQLTAPRYLPEVRGNLLTGRVTTSGAAPATGQLVYLSLPSKNYLFYASKTDSTGRFFFNSEKIMTTSDLVLQINPALCADCQISLDNHKPEDLSAFVPDPLVLDSSYRQLIEKRSLLAQIENAYYLQKQDSIAVDPRPTRFYGQPDKSYRLDDYVRFPTLQDIFIEYVTEVILKGKSEQYEIKVMNFKARTAFAESPLILIDGIPIFNNEMLMNYNPLLLDKIEVVGRRYFYGPLEVQGIISLTTYTGDARNISLPHKESYIGIQPKKKYYSPDYTSHREALSKIPDYRIQLYWNPELTPGSTAAYKFYTSDIAGDFEIVVEGFLKNGKPIHQRKIIHVQDR